MTHTEAGRLHTPKEQDVELVGPNGLRNQLTKNVLETGLDAEMASALAMTRLAAPCAPVTFLGFRNRRSRRWRRDDWDGLRHKLTPLTT